MTGRTRLLAVLDGVEPREPVVCPLVDSHYASEFMRRVYLFFKTPENAADTSRGNTTPDQTSNQGVG